MNELELFLSVLALPDHLARSVFLAEHCAANPQLRERLEELLAAYRQAEQMLPAVASKEIMPTELYKEPVAKLGNRLQKGTLLADKYELQEKIGEGGMGEVWIAWQNEPVKRKVAVKFIKAGMDSNAVLRRFDQERQALAVMDHPNIAKVFDGGLTNYATPFFVMELVAGLPLNKYCDESRLPIQDRLELYVSICHAVQHAHQKGIVHRDLKPGNILVTLIDGKPTPKIIDFGVAKAVSGKLTEESLSTQLGAIIGTMEYMAPEQAGLSTLDVDTRADIYSLGVILYELLTGLRPFDSKRLRQAALQEVIRILNEEEPPSLASRLLTDESLPSVAAVRQTEPRRLLSMMKSELDWIVHKCLEKDRNRRYDTVNGLARDIQRYLANEPVEARPPSNSYRLQKFVRRNHIAVMAGSAIAVSLMVGIVGFAWQAQIAQRERDAAQTERDIANSERARAVTAESETKKRANELKLVSDFQAQMLEQVNPTKAGKLLSADVRAKYEESLVKSGVQEKERILMITDFTKQWERVNATDAARKLIDQTILTPAVSAISKQFSEQPLVAATLLQVLAERYAGLGEFVVALPLVQQTLQIRKKELGEDHADTLYSLNILGMMLQAMGQLVSAETQFQEVLEKRRRVLGEDHQDTLASINNVGTVLLAMGKYRHAEPYLRETWEKRKRLLGEEQAHTLTSSNNLGLVLQHLGKLTEAEPFLFETMKKRRIVLGQEHPDTLTSINNYGYLLLAQNKLSETEPYYLEALQKRRLILGEEHPDTLQSINNMGFLLQAQGKLEEAEPYMREAIQKARRVMGEEHPNTLNSINTLASLLMSQGKHRETAELLANAEPTARKVLPEINPTAMGILLMNLGKSRAKLRQFALAEPNLIEAHGLCVKTRGPVDELTRIIANFYADWNTAEPGKGYDTKALEWTKKLDAIKVKPVSGEKQP